MSAVKIPMYPSPYENDPAMKSDAVLRLPNGKRFGVGAIPEGAAARKVYQGPLIAGPWAFTFGLAVVIDNYPERRAAERAKDFEVDEGSLVEIEYKVYQVKVVRREYINLVPVE